MNMNQIKIPILAAIICVAFGWASAWSVGDEILIGGTSEAVTIGDFNFSSCSSEPSSALALINSGAAGKVTAGDLWQFFSDRGIESVENLTICMDLACERSVDEQIGLAGLRLQIQDPIQLGTMITNVNFGDNSLVVPISEISALKPEAKLGVALGYDFMKRFDADSKEIISLDFANSDQAGLATTFSFEGTSAPTRAGISWPMLIGFVVFWLALFKCLAIITAPKRTGPATDSPSQSVLSA